MDDAAATDTSYYGPGSTCADVSAADAAAWAGLPCRTAMAAAPDGGSGQLVETTVTGYTLNLAQTQAVSTAGDATTTVTTDYNTAGLPVATSMQQTGGTPDGFPAAVDVPDTTLSYDPATGLPTTVTTTTTTDVASEAGADTDTATDAGEVSVSTGYDSWGRPISSTDAHGVSATSGYDAAGRVAAVDTGQTSIGYGYDSGTDFRGLPTSTTFTPSAQAARAALANVGADQVTTTWDVSGAPATTGVTGITSTTTVDAAGNTVGLSHVASDGTVVGQYGQVFDGFARVQWQTASAGDATVLGGQAPDVTESFFYDLAGRLTRVQQNGELNRPGSRGGSQSWERMSVHGSTEEVQRGVEGPGHPDGDRRPTGPGHRPGSDQADR